MTSGDLREAAAVTIERLRVSRGDSFLVASNPTLAPIADAIADAAREQAERVRAVEFPPTTRHGEEPPEDVAAAMAEASAMALVTEFSLSHTSARLTATRKGARV